MNRTVQCFFLLLFLMIPVISSPSIIYQLELNDYYNADLTTGYRDFAINPQSWDYGDVEVMNPAPKVFEMSNYGDQGTITIIYFGIDGTDPGDFALDAPPTPFDIAENTTSELTVTFLPLTEGAKSAYLYIQLENEALPRTYALSGNAIPEEIGRPVALSATIVNYVNILLEWTLSYGAVPGWLSWHTGAQASVLGSGTQWYAAVKFGIAELIVFEGEGYELTQVAFIPNHSDPGVDEPSYSVMVWTGNDADLGPTSILVDQSIPEVTFGTWNTIDLDIPVAIAGDEPLWVGFFIDGPGSFPMVLDEGPLVPGKGGLLSGNGITWSQLSTINRNWMIEAYAEPADPSNGSERIMLNIPVTQNTTGNNARQTDRIMVEEVQLPSIENRSTRELIGYNIYRNNDLHDFTTVPFYMDYELPEAAYDYYVEAVYHSQNSLPSNVATTGVILYPPFELPFFEGWDSGNFITNYWTRWLDNWVFSNEEGQPAPAVLFNFTPNQTNYSTELASWTLSAIDYETVTAQFDLSLLNYSTDTVEQMSFQVFDGSDWQTIVTFNNQQGDISWAAHSYDISIYAANSEFKVRFLAQGQDSWNIDWWAIDNILIEGIPPEIDEPQVNILIDNGIVELSWVAVEHANSYTVYASSEPYAQFPDEWTLVTQIEETSYTEIIEEIRFYRVVASTDQLPVRNIPASFLPAQSMRSDRLLRGTN